MNLRSNEKPPKMNPAPDYDREFAREVGDSLGRYTEREVIAGGRLEKTGRTVVCPVTGNSTPEYKLG